MQIGSQMRRTAIPHLKPILNTSKLKIEIQFEMKWYSFLSVQQQRQIATLKRKLRLQTGLLNTSQAVAHHLRHRVLVPSDLFHVQPLQREPRHDAADHLGHGLQEGCRDRGVRLDEGADQNGPPEHAWLFQESLGSNSNI